VYGQSASSEGVLLSTTNQMVSSPFPRPLKYPRRGVGRNGAFGVAMRWRQRHHCPRHPDEHGGQDQGTGQEQGRTRQINEQEVRALCVPYRRANRGLSRLITVSRNRCSTALTWPSHVVPKL